MEWIYRLADTRPRTQIIVVVASIFLGPLLGLFTAGSPMEMYWLPFMFLYAFLLASPNVARIIREAQTEIMWFFSRATAFNLGGGGLILVFGPAILGVPASDAGGGAGYSFLAIATTSLLGMLALFAALVSFIGYFYRFVRSGAREISSKRKVDLLLKEKLSDGVLSDDEYRELVDLSESLGLPREKLEEARRKAFSEAVSPLLKAIKSERRMSPEQEERLHEIAKSHQIMPHLDHSMLIFRQLWQIENTGKLELHPIDVGGAIRLVKGEECYLAIPAVWKQLKKRRINTGYVGGSVGFRVAKGVTLRVGKAVPSYRETEALETIASGRMFVTNKKILFVGDKKSTNITFGRLAGYEVARDAVQVNKTSGKPDVFFMRTEDVEVLDAHLQIL